MRFLPPALTRNQASRFGQFHWWQGASGAWFIHTVEPFTRYLSYPGSVIYVFVRRDLITGKVTPLYIGQSGEFSDRLLGHEKFESALRLGANEIHVHLLAETAAARFAAETDLRNGHRTPLNEQPTMAGLLGALAGPRTTFPAPRLTLGALFR